MINHRFTAEFFDDEDRRPSWDVIEWIEQRGAFRTGRVVESHRTQADAESAAVAYNLINAYCY